MSGLDVETSERMAAFLIILIAVLAIVGLSLGYARCEHQANRMQACILAGHSPDECKKAFDR